MRAGEQCSAGSLNVYAQRGLEPPVWIVHAGNGETGDTTSEAPEHRIRALTASLGLAAGPQTVSL